LLLAQNQQKSKQQPLSSSLTPPKSPNTQSVACVIDESCRRVFPCFELWFEEEYLSKPSKEEFSHELNLLREYETRQHKELGQERDVFMQEEYESVRLKQYSKVFKRFQKIVSQNPQQTVR
jgi:hypothetical protein